VGRPPLQFSELLDKGKGCRKEEERGDVASHLELRGEFFSLRSSVRGDRNLTGQWEGKGGGGEISQMKKGGIYFPLNPKGKRRVSFRKGGKGPSGTRCLGRRPKKEVSRRKKKRFPTGKGRGKERDVLREEKGVLFC